MQMILLFILGLSVGSFLNVLIDRLPKDESILGRSHCDHCKHQLSWYDLIPLLSFSFLQGRCRYCRHKLSWQYPIVELTTGFLIAYSYSSTPGEPLRVTPGVPLSPLYSPEAIFLSIVISGLIVIFFTDLKYRIIPDQILGLLVFVSLIYLMIYQADNFFDHLISAMAGFLLFLSLVILTRGKGMGLGDVKFVFVIGLILGFPLIIVSLYLSFLTGAAISLILVIRGKKTMKSTIPFGPFLSGGAIVTLFYGQELWNVFKKIIGI